MKKLLYINDYAVGDSYVDLCNKQEYPSQHLWGLDKLRNTYSIKYAYAKKSKKFPRLRLFLNNILFFLRNCNVDIVYSALPGYSLFFLLAKKLGLKNYKIVTIIHHPNSRILFPSLYDRMICISPYTFDKFHFYANSEYLFWGGDWNFYEKWKELKGEKNISFISAGKTYRDYFLLEKVMNELGVSYKIFGNRNSQKNEISYLNLMNYYNASRFVVIPVVDHVNLNAQVLCGLTSFIDAVMLGIPILMSDNTLIGIDIEKKNMGYVYRAGDELDLRNKVNKLLNLSDFDYLKMRESCLEFARINCYNKFCDRLLEILK